MVQHLQTGKTVHIKVLRVYKKVALTKILKRLQEKPQVFRSSMCVCPSDSIYTYTK